MNPKIFRSLLPVLVAMAIAAAVAALGGQESYRMAWRWIPGGMPLLWGCALLAFLIQWLVWVPSYLTRTEKLFDLTGGVTFLALLGLTALVVGQISLADKLLLAMCAVWAVRLGTFLALRVQRAGHDRRFEHIKTDALRFLLAWTLQGLWVFLTLCPVLVVVGSPRLHQTSAWTFAGAALWALGFVLEVAADWQKSRFRSDPANAGRFISTGLWAWSRHPNYAGEILLWLGVFVVCLPMLQGVQWVVVLSPLFVMLLITRVSGVPMLEAAASKRWGADAAYQAYVACTPCLWPRRPKVQQPPEAQ